MDARYEAWIDAYEAKQKSLLGMCASATMEMVADFPELRRIGGHVLVPLWGRRAHWWCETPDGEIVDPTASQFPDIAEYEPFVPGSEVRVSRCMNCGDDIFACVDSLTEPLPKGTNTTFCTSACEADMAKAMGW